MPHTLRSAAVLACALLAACGGGDAGAENSVSDDDDSMPAESATEAVGRCAVDARDGAPYGRIAAAETDAASGATVYQIEGEGATWNKRAENIRVVDCP